MIFQKVSSWFLSFALVISAIFNGFIFPPMIAHADGGFVISLTYLSIDAVDYNDGFWFAVGKFSPIQEITAEGQSVSTSGLDNLDWATCNVTGGAHDGESVTVVHNQVSFNGGVNELQDYLTSQLSATGTVCTNFFSSANLTANGATSSYSWSLPGVASYAAGSDPADSGYLDYAVTPGEYTVNDDSDIGDADPGDGMCDNGLAVCTLRAAIEESNADGITSTINFSGLTVHATSDLNLKDDVTLTGDGIIDFDSTGQLLIQDGANGVDNVLIDGITIQDTDNSCIFVLAEDLDEDGDSVIITNSTITSCPEDGIDAGGDGITISDNTLSLFNLTTGGSAISIYAGDGVAETSDDIVVAGNTITGSAIDDGNSGIELGRASLVENADIYDNTINTVQIGISLTSATDTIIGADSYDEGNGISDVSWAMGFAPGSDENTVKYNTIETAVEFGLLIASSFNTVYNNIYSDVGMGIQLDGDDVSNNTFNDEFIEATGNGIHITGGSVTDNIFTDVVIHIQPSVETAVAIAMTDTLETDVNELHNVTFKDFHVETGTLEVYYDASARVTNNGVAVSGATVIATDFDDAPVEEVTDVSGIAEFDDFHAYDLTVDNEGDFPTNNFASNDGELGEGDFDVVLNTKDRVVSLDYAAEYYSSFSPISIDDVDYNSRMIYMCAVDGGVEVSNDDTPVYCADGVDGFDWGVIEVLGGDYIGEKWSVLASQDYIYSGDPLEQWAFLLMPLIGDASNIRPLADGTNLWYLNEDPNVWAPEAEGEDYNFGTPGVASYAANATDPGTLTFGPADGGAGDDYYASFSPLNVGGTDYSDQFAYFNPDEGPIEIEADDDVMSMDSSYFDPGFDWGLITLNGVMHVTWLFPRAAYADQTAVETMLDAAVEGEIIENYTIDFYTGPGSEQDLPNLLGDYPWIYSNGADRDFTFFWYPESVMGEYGVSFADTATYPAYLSIEEGPFPTVSLTSATETSISENGGTTTLTFTLSEVLDHDIEIYIGWDGIDLGFEGEDVDAYLAAGDLVILAGETTTDLTLTAADNAEVDGNRMGTIYAFGINQGDGYVVDVNQTVTLTIVDDDEPVGDDDDGGGYIIIGDDDTGDDDDDVTDDTADDDIQSDDEGENVSEEVEDEIDQATTTVIDTVTEKITEEDGEQSSDFADVIFEYESESHESPEEAGELIPDVLLVEEAEDLLSALDRENLTDEQVSNVEDQLNEPYQSYFGSNVYIVFKPLYDEGTEKLVSELEAGGYTVLLLDENSDYDNDGMPDVLQIAYGFEMFNTNEDGFTNADRLFFGTNEMISADFFDLPKVTNIDGLTVGSTPSFRVAGEVGDEIELFLIPASSYDGNNDDFVEEMSLGKTIIDQGHKGEVMPKYAISNGTYYVIPQGQKGFGKAVKFTVDSAMDTALKTPKFTKIDNTQEQKLLMIGMFVRIPLDALSAATDWKFDTRQYIALKMSQPENIQIIRGKTTPNSRVFIVLRSVVFSSVALSDASGNFEVRVADSTIDLQNEEHSMTAYAGNAQKQIGSAGTVSTLRSQTVK